MTHSLADYKALLTEKSFASKFARYGHGLKVAAERTFALQIIQKNPRLRECTPQSVQNALMDVAYMGLSLSPSLAHVYLVPYKNHCDALISYLGLLHLAFKAGTVKSVQTVLVREKDEFHVGTDKGGRFVIHREARMDRGEVTNVYCIAEFTNGGRHIEVMDREELAAVERAASARNEKGGAVWRGPFRGEMMKKACIRRAWKSWPKDAALEHAAEVMNRVEPMDFTIEGEAVPVISPEQVSTLVDLCNDLGIDEGKFARAFNVSSIESIPASHWEEARHILTKRAER
jgi:recombination protein RecT